ncbi:MAG: hypothetical protein BWK78_07690 [Thiotrichaceae bacterium IS1]|nr:MAG: hypothetical protein BWK78_07690 [Thiotrichaceae bacterium IS1]
MIVVSNTSPLTNLAAIGQFHLLPQLYQNLQIAEGVWQELNAYQPPPPGCQEVASAPWIYCHTVQNRSLVIALRQDLDKGEAETLALAIELSADLVLLDEKEARHQAQRLELNKTGVVGIWLEAKKQGYLTQVKPHLEALRQKAGFYLHDSLYQQALWLAKE